MCWMDIPDFKSCTLSRQTSGPKSRQPPFMRNLRQWIRLVHKLRKLTAAEKLLYSSYNRFSINQVMRQGTLNIQNVHTLLDTPLHPGEAYPELILQEFTNTPDPSVSKMIYIINLTLIGFQVNKVSYSLHDVLRRKCSLAER